MSAGVRGRMIGPIPVQVQSIRLASGDIVPVFDPLSVPGDALLFSRCYLGG